MEIHFHELHDMPSGSLFDLSCRSSRTSGTASRCLKAGWCTMCPAGTAMGCPLSSKHWETWEPVGWLLYKSDRKVRKSHIMNVLTKESFILILKAYVLFCFWLPKNCLCVSPFSAGVCREGHLSAACCIPALGRDGWLGQLLLHFWWEIWSGPAESLPGDAQQGERSSFCSTQLDWLTCLISFHMWGFHHPPKKGWNYLHYRSEV